MKERQGVVAFTKRTGPLSGPLSVPLSAARAQLSLLVLMLLVD